MNTTGKILTVFATGAAVGAILGVLLAPAKGSEIRQKIRDKGRKLSDDFKGKFQKAKENFDELKEEVKRVPAERIDDFEEA